MVRSKPHLHRDRCRKFLFKSFGKLFQHYLKLLNNSVLTIIGRFGDDFRWASIDKEIHISSFLEDHTEPNHDNEIARIFALFPQLNVSEIARSIGINKSLLSKYIYGIKKRGEARKPEIISALHSLGCPAFCQPVALCVAGVANRSFYSASRARRKPRLKFLVV